MSGEWATLVGIAWPFSIPSTTDDYHLKLLFGPYQPSKLKVGDHAFCLYRDAEIVIYDWSLAPIPWALFYHAESRAFGKGLLVDEELARAIRSESGMAVGYW